jgi:hypothetical protein
MQIFMQQDVMELIINEEFLAKIATHQQMFFNYFVQRDFDDPVVDIMLFSSIYKGFTLQYVYAPYLFDKEAINRFKLRMKEMFFKPLKKDNSQNIEFNDSIGYMLT